MDLALQDRYCMLSGEYNQLAEKDNVFTQTKNIIEKTSLITREYIAAAYLWRKASRTLMMLDLIPENEKGAKESDKTYKRVQKLEASLSELHELAEGNCLKAWVEVFTKSPDMVQQYFFNEELKVQKESIGTVLKEIMFYLFQAIEKENMIEQEPLNEFIPVLKKMLKDIYKC